MCARLDSLLAFGLLLGCSTGLSSSPSDGADAPTSNENGGTGLGGSGGGAGRDGGERPP